MEPKTKLLDQVRDAIRRIGQTKGIFAPSHCKRIPLERPSVPPGGYASLGVFSRASREEPAPWSAPAQGLGQRSAAILGGHAPQDGGGQNRQPI